MKKYIKIVLLFFIGVTCTVIAKSMLPRSTMSAEKVKEKWGDGPVDYKKFKTGDESVRAKMAYAILNDKSLIGEDVQSLREKLGRPNGFYFIDSYPAYFIQKGKNHSEDTWQIVFTLNSKYKVRDVFVHKNCCDR